MQKIILTGNLTKDPDAIRTTANGKDVCSFTIAVNRKMLKDGKPVTDFFRINAWGAKAKSCHDYLAKGKKVSVIGELQLTQYKGKDGSMKSSLDVQADEVEFLSPKSGDPIASDPVPMNDLQDIDPSDIPF